MLELTDQQRGRLLALRNGPGYDELLEVIRGIGELATLELLNVNRARGASDTQALSALEKAQAFRLCGQAIVDEIQAQCDVFMVEQKARHDTAAANRAIGAFVDITLSDEEFPGTPTNEQVLGMGMVLEDPKIRALPGSEKAQG